MIIDSFFIDSCTPGRIVPHFYHSHLAPSHPHLIPHFCQSNPSRVHPHLIPHFISYIQRGAIHILFPTFISHIQRGSIHPQFHIYSSLSSVTPSAGHSPLFPTLSVTYRAASSTPYSSLLSHLDWGNRHSHRYSHFHQLHTAQRHHTLFPTFITSRLGAFSPHSPLLSVTSSAGLSTPFLPLLSVTSSATSESLVRLMNSFWICSSVRPLVSGRKKVARGT